jgi:hypothetical protein
MADAENETAYTSLSPLAVRSSQTVMMVSQLEHRADRQPARRHGP